MSAPVGVEGGQRVGDCPVDVAVDGHTAVAAGDLDGRALRVEAVAPVYDPVAARVEGDEADAVVERRRQVPAEPAAALAR